MKSSHRDETPHIMRIVPLPEPAIWLVGFLHVGSPLNGSQLAVQADIFTCSLFSRQIRLFTCHKHGQRVIRSVDLLHVVRIQVASLWRWKRGEKKGGKQKQTKTKRKVGNWRVEVSQRDVILLGSTRTTAKKLYIYIFKKNPSVEQVTHSVYILADGLYPERDIIYFYLSYFIFFSSCTEIWPEAAQCKRYTIPDIRVFNGSEKMAQRETVLHNAHPWGWETWGGIERRTESTDP